MNVTFINLSDFSLKPYRKKNQIRWDNKTWITQSDLNLELEVKGKIHKLTIPKGFVTNFASVPKVFWNLISPYDAGEAAVLHDFLYKYQIFDKQTCDRLFLKGMKVIKVGFLKRNTMHNIVCWLGDSTWEKYKLDLKNNK